MSTPHELGPLPRASVRDYAREEDGYTADQVRAYALAEVARAVEAERATRAELLEALRDLMKYVEYARRVVPPDLYSVGIDKARAAIAKAEGAR